MKRASTQRRPILAASAGASIPSSSGNEAALAAPTASGAGLSGPAPAGPAGARGDGSQAVALAAAGFINPTATHSDQGLGGEPTEQLEPVAAPDNTLAAALTATQEALEAFLEAPSFEEAIRTAFGEDADVATARAILEGFATGGQDALPTIAVVDAATIHQARGAYAAETDTVYLSEELLADRAGAGSTVAVLLEELGHALDARLNAADAAGDEGAIFAALVQGGAHAPDAATLAALRREDDTLVAEIDGETVTLEQSSFSLGVVEGLRTSGDYINYLDPDDYWQFTITTTATAGHYVRIGSDNAAVDLDLQLFDSNGTWLASSASVQNAEEISLASLPAGTYRARVYDYHGTGRLGASNAYYAIQFNAPIPPDALEENDAPEQATPVTAGALVPDVGYWFSGLSIDGSQGGEDVDWFRFTIDTPATQDHYVCALITSDDGIGDIDLALWDESLNPLYTTYWTATGSDWNMIPLAGLQPGTYYLEAGSYQRNLTPSYDLLFALPEGVAGDQYEEGAGNDLPENAADLGVANGWTIEPELSIHTPTDLDWFRFELDQAGRSEHGVGIVFDASGSGADLDIGLFTIVNNDVRVVGWSDGYDQTEWISLAGAAPGDYWLAVYSADGGVADYGLAIHAPGSSGDIAADQFEANNTRGAATNLSSPEAGWPTSTGLKAWEYLSIGNGDRDWYQFDLPVEGAEGTFIGIGFDHSAGDLDLRLYDDDGDLIDAAEGARDVELIELADLSAGTYYAQVSGYQGATNPNYTLAINVGGQDPFEQNDTSGHAAPLHHSRPVQTWDSLSIHSGEDVDWFRFNLSQPGTRSDHVEIAFDHAKGDLDLEVYEIAGYAEGEDGAEQPIAGPLADFAYGVGNRERISLSGLEAGDYLIKVFGYDGATNPSYSLTVAAPVANVADWLEANNARGSATDLNAQRQLGDQRDLIEFGMDPNRPLSIHSTTDKDWFRFELAEEGRVGDEAVLSLDHTAGDLDLFLYDASGALVDSAEGVANQHRIALDQLGAASDYYLLVAGYQGATNPSYSLSVRAPFASDSDGDQFEANDSSGAATELLLDPFTGDIGKENLSIHTTGDEDWYRFETHAVGAPGDAVSIAFRHALGDLDMELYAADGTTRLDSSAGVSDSERISLDGRPAGEYLVRVFGYDDATNPTYSLTIDGPAGTGGDWAEGNDSAASAYDLRQVDGTQTWDPLSIHAAGDEDWFRFEIDRPAGPGDQVQISFDHTQGDLDLWLYSENGTEILGSSETIENSETVALTNAAGQPLTAGSYLIKVAGYQGATNPSYRLVITAPTRTAPDWAEGSQGNDQQGNATDLRQVEGSVRHGDLSLHTGDVDWFQFETVGEAGPGHSVGIAFDRDEGDLQLALYDDAGTLLAESTSDSNQERISLEELAAGDYYVKVDGADSATTSPGYELVFDVPQGAEPDFAEDNDTRADAYDLRGVTGVLRVAGLSIDAASDKDWFKMTLERAPTATESVRIDFDRWEGDLSLALYDASGNQLADSETAQHFEEIAFADVGDGNLGSGPYYVRVAAAEGMANPDYTMTVTGNPELEADGAEPNDSPDRATRLRDIGSTAENPLSGVFQLDAGVDAQGRSVSPFEAMQFILSINTAPTYNGDEIGTVNSAISNPGAIYGSPVAVGFAQAFNAYDGAQQYANLTANQNQGSSFYDRYGDPLNPLESAGLTQTGTFRPDSLPFAPLSGLAGVPSSSPASNSYSNSGGYNLGGSSSPWSNNQLALALLLAGFLGQSRAGATPAVLVPDLSIHGPDDEDWFQFELTEDGTEGASVSITFDHDQGDLKLELFEGFDTQSNTSESDYQRWRIETSNGRGNTEEIGLADLAEGRYFLRVSGVDGAVNPSYALAVNAPIAMDDTGGDWAESNESRTTAYDLRSVDGGRLLTGLSIHAADDEDWFRFETQRNGRDGDFVRIDFSHAAGDLDLELYSASGTLLGSSEGTADFEQIALQGQGSGTYYARVYRYDGAIDPVNRDHTLNYTLTVAAPSTEIEPDALEPNDTRATATRLDLVDGFSQLGATIHAGDEDYYRFETRRTGEAGHSVSIRFEDGLGELRLAVYREDSSSAAATTIASDGHASVSMRDLDPDVYYARVRGADPQTENAYRLQIDAPVDETAEHNAWTVLVYMTASNLTQAAFSDVNEMELATTGLSDRVNFVTLWDQSAAQVPGPYPTAGSPAWGDTGQGVILADGNDGLVATPFERLGEQNTGSQTTLEEFLDWGIQAAPADHYALVLWDHGSGPNGRFNSDDSDGLSADALVLSELRAAVENQGADQHNPLSLDLIAFDACLMGSVEMAYGLRDCAEVLVASEEVVAGDGYDYTNAFAALAGDPSDVTAEALASSLIDSFGQQYRYHSRGWNTLAATASGAVDELVTALNGFTDAALASTSASVWNALAAARDATTTYGGSHRDYYDLGQFVDQVAADGSLPAGLQQTAEQVRDALDDAVFDRTADPRRSSGLLIHFPDDGELDPLYATENQAFLGASGWDDFLTGFANRATRTTAALTDWAGGNHIAARARNLQKLTGPDHSFDGLSLTGSGDVDWFRFTTNAAGTAGDGVSLRYDTGSGQQATLELYRIDDRDAPLDTANGPTGNHRLSLADAEPRQQYLLRVASANGAVPSYSLEIDAPGDVTSGVDWASGNRSQGKAEDLGVIAGDAWFTGLYLAASETDWFLFEVPKHEGTQPGQLLIHANAGGALAAELFTATDDGAAGASLASASGSGDLALEYPGGPGDRYLVKLTRPAGLAATAYALVFSDADEAPVNVVMGTNGADVLTGTDQNDALLGLAGNDRLSGLAGADLLVAGPGADRLDGGADADRLYGGTGTDRLLGQAGADRLDGGFGPDWLEGGAGNDVYVVIDRGDRIVELGDVTQGGQDRVESALSQTLEDGVEDLSLSGLAPINGTGNALANRLHGNAAANRLDGRGGDDQLLGRDGADELLGGDGADRLEGGAGADRLYGLAGDDHLDGGRDADHLDGGDGDDILVGRDGEDRLAGGAGSDVLTGGNGRDRLEGGAGTDMLFGGDGADAFRFVTTGEGIDELVDFTSGVDTIEVVSRNFGDLPVGTLAPGRFLSAGATPSDGQAAFLYDRGSGALSFDSNGNGLGGVTPLARLLGPKELVAQDIHLVLA